MKRRPPFGSFRGASASVGRGAAVEREGLLQSVKVKGSSRPVDTSVEGTALPSVGPESCKLQ